VSVRPYLLFLALAALSGSGVRGAQVSATGISIPFFNDAGKLTHRLLAKSGTKSGDIQNLRSVEVHYFAPADPKVIVQKIEASEATWDAKKETLVGYGAIVVATLENRLTGDGFDFALATALLHIHRNFTMTNRELRLTSDRATIELIVDRKDEDVKVTDVKRCEAIGNLHIVVQPAAYEKYRLKEAFSDLAIYDGATKIVSLPHPTRTLKVDGGEGRFNTLTIDLRDQGKKAEGRSLD
jgi:hypothetical protein